MSQPTNIFLLKDVIYIAVTRMYYHILNICSYIRFNLGKSLK